MKKSIIIITMILSLFTTSAFSETKMVIDLEKLDSSIVANILKANKESISNNIPDVSKLEKFAEVGTQIGVAIKQLCQTLNVEVNEFIKTPAGIIITGVIIYRCGGKDILKLLILMIFCFIGYIVTLSSTYFWLSNKKVCTDVVDKIKSYQYIPRHDFDVNDDGKIACVVIHVISLIIITLIFIITICNI